MFRLFKRLLNFFWLYFGQIPSVIELNLFNRNNFIPYNSMLNLTFVKFNICFFPSSCSKKMEGKHLYQQQRCVRYLVSPPSNYNTSTSHCCKLEKKN